MTLRLVDFNRDQFKDILECIDTFRCGLVMTEERYYYSVERVEFQKDRFVIKIDVYDRGDWNRLAVYFSQNSSESSICKAVITINSIDFNSNKVSFLLRNSFHRKWKKDKADYSHCYSFFPINAEELQILIDLFFIKKQFT